MDEAALLTEFVAAQCGGGSPAGDLPRTRMTGVCPRRPQVQARGGVIEKPASSSKTIQAPDAAPRLHLGPHLPPPHARRVRVLCGRVPARTSRAVSTAATPSPPTGSPTGPSRSPPSSRPPRTSRRPEAGSPHETPEAQRSGPTLWIPHLIGIPQGSRTVTARRQPETSVGPGSEGDEDPLVSTHTRMSPSRGAPCRLTAAQPRPPATAADRGIGGTRENGDTGCLL